MSMDLACFQTLWCERWGSDAEPFGWWLRGGPTWVRFHSLPESKRYADTEMESAEILNRHTTLIEELAGPESDRLVIMAHENWSASGEQPWVKNAFPDAIPWREERYDEELYSFSAVLVSFGPNRLRDLIPVLRRIADFEIEGVLITDETLDWLYCPYDGGADVLARSEAERDQLKAAHPEWLPQNAMGL
jgi:hypothetical protein